MADSEHLGDADKTQPRLVEVSRRRFMLTTLLGGAVIAAGCGNGDAAIFETGDDTTPSTGSDTTSASNDDPATTTTNETADVADSADGSGENEPSTLNVSEMLVAFSYTPDGTGKRENPYVAVWVETPAGDLVDTVAVWFDQSSKGDRWIDDLRSWYPASGNGSEVSMSSATRAAGAYVVAWDLTDIAGAEVPAGDYVVFVESARERGPHHITSSPINVATAEGVTLADDGELHNVAVSWV